MIIVKLESLLESRGKTAYWLAKETGITYANIYNVIKGKTKAITFESLDKICETLDCRLEEVIDYIPNEKAER